MRRNAEVLLDTVETNNMDKVPVEVFHYTKLQTALEKIFVTRKIKFGQVGLTNDPRETKEWFLHAWHIHDPQISDDQRHKIYNRRDEKLSIEGNRIRCQEWKVFCASQHVPGYFNADDRKKENPFWRGDCRPKMWAYYGENHAGVCLKLNGHKLTQKLLAEMDGKGNRKIYHGPVDYDDKKSTHLGSLEYSEIESLGTREGMRKFCRDYNSRIFLVKSKDWENEYEYRWLIHKPDTKNLPEFISIEDILEGVLVGLDFPKVYKPLISELCKELNIPVGEMVWRNGWLYPEYGSIYAP
jgi:hypothetical protein